MSITWKLCYLNSKAMVLVYVSLCTAELGRMVGISFKVAYTRLLWLIHSHEVFMWSANTSVSSFTCVKHWHHCLWESWASETGCLHCLVRAQNGLSRLSETLQHGNQCGWRFLGMLCCVPMVCLLPLFTVIFMSPLNVSSFTFIMLFRSFSHIRAIKIVQC